MVVNRALPLTLTCGVPENTAVEGDPSACPQARSTCMPLLQADKRIRCIIAPERDDSQTLSLMQVVGANLRRSSVALLLCADCGVNFARG